MGGRKFTLKRWYRRGLKEANLFGRKTVCRRWGRAYGTAKPVKQMSAYLKIVLCRLKNRLA
ncbi:hypothetical protein HMPREF9442_02429 [Paraprevotella xylaniphila YIT 11841]|uniref:Uncharacterized protein n=1 Tax=Paraprevotella xylaniphila YIT 11841 TaxID=762982 RepID=F3QW48_9BACT|nr:hypothetical protein HMPREF9442_02429 [Paraprevotella xylaniphila YIT 11841]